MSKKFPRVWGKTGRYRDARHPKSLPVDYSLSGRSSDSVPGTRRPGARAAIYIQIIARTMQSLAWRPCPFSKKILPEAGLNYNDDMSNMSKDHMSWSKMFDEKMQLKAEVASLETKMAGIGMALEVRHDEMDLLVEEVEHKKKSLVEITKKLRSVS